MKRSPLKRGTKPLKRHTRLSPKRKTPRRSGRAKPKRPPGYENLPYLAFVRTLPCCAWTAFYSWQSGSACVGRVVPHHAGVGGGTGLKAPDDTSVPLCVGHHTGRAGWHTSNGFAKDWTKEQRRSWSDARIFDTQAAWAATKGAA